MPYSTITIQNGLVTEKLEGDNLNHFDPSLIHVLFDEEDISENINLLAETVTRFVELRYRESVVGIHNDALLDTLELQTQQLFELIYDIKMTLLQHMYQDVKNGKINTPQQLFDTEYLETLPGFKFLVKDVPTMAILLSEKKSDLNGFNKAFDHAIAEIKQEIDLTPNQSSLSSRIIDTIYDGFSQSFLGNLSVFCQGHNNPDVEPTAVDHQFN